MEISIVGEIRTLWQWIRDEMIDKKPHISKPDGDYCILCVEVGHMLSKASLLKLDLRNGKIETFKIGTVEKRNSEDFFGENNFEKFLLWIDEWIKKDSINGLSLSLGCPVMNQHIAQTPRYWQWPDNLYEVIHQELNISNILFLNDAVAFAFDCLTEKLKQPILCLTLGGGIGCAVIRNKQPYILSFEGGIISKRWPDGFEGDIHILAGEPFFIWAKREYPNNQNKVIQLYTQRIFWIIDSIKKELERPTHEKIEIQSVILGGGRTNIYLEPSQLDQYLINNIPGISYKIKPGIEPPLSGLGKAWIQHFIYEQPMRNLVGILK
jgi:hypothetical protein